MLKGLLGGGLWDNALLMRRNPSGRELGLTSLGLAGWRRLKPCCISARVLTYQPNSGDQVTGAVPM